MENNKNHNYKAMFLAWRTQNKTCGLEEEKNVKHEYMIYDSMMSY